MLQCGLLRSNFALAICLSVPCCSVVRAGQRVQTRFASCRLSRDLRGSAFGPPFCDAKLERVKGIEPSSSAWKAAALPLSYTRMSPAFIDASSGVASRRELPPSCAAPHAKAGGGGRTRTYEGVSQRIYSPPPLPLGTLSQTCALASSSSKDKRDWPAGRPGSGALWSATLLEVNGSGGALVNRRRRLRKRPGPYLSWNRPYERRCADRQPDRPKPAPRPGPAQSPARPASRSSAASASSARAATALQPRRRHRRPLRLAHREGGAGESGARDPQAARHRKRRAPSHRGRRRAARRAGDRAARRHRRAAVARRRASGPLSRSRSPALAADRGARAGGRRAGARPDHRSAQCRRDLPLGRGLRRDRRS